MKAVLLVSHGSKNKKTLEEVRVTTEKLQSQNPDHLVDFAFMEIENPLIPEGVKSCIDRGAKEVLILLNFLNTGRHTQEDVPEIVEGVKREYPDIKISISSPVGQQEGMIDLFTTLIHES